MPKSKTSPSSSASASLTPRNGAVNHQAPGAPSSSTRKAQSSQSASAAAASPAATMPTANTGSQSPRGKASPRSTSGSAPRRCPAHRVGTLAGHLQEPGVRAIDLGMEAPIGPAVIDLLALAYRADIPALLIGAHGLGKSEVTAAAAASLGIDCISRDLSLMEPPDLVGLPKILETAGGGVTTFLPPAFLPRKTGRGGFLLLEEINRAPRYMQACCLELLTSRQLNGYVLPKGWLPVACINPKVEGYAVDLLDAALMSRFMQINVCASVDSWTAWAASNGIDAHVIEYVATVPDALDESKGGSSPRSWTYASRTLQAAGAELLERSPDTIVTALNGLVGPVHTTALLRLVYGTEVALKPADLVTDWPSAKATMKRWRKHGRLDLLAASMRAVLQWLRPDGVAQQVRDDPTLLAAVRGFFKLLPGDLAEQATAWLLEVGYVHLIPTVNERAA